MNSQKKILNKIIFYFPFFDKRAIFWLLSGQWQQKSHQSSFEAAGHGQRINNTGTERHMTQMEKKK